MKKISNLVILVLLYCGVAVANDYPRDLFAVAQMRVDSVRQPHGLEWYLQSREAEGILSSVAGYMGVNPAYVKLALEVLPTASVSGEETNYGLPVPDGYVFCAVRVAVNSLNPGSGDRASVIGVSASENMIAVYTWTPVGHLGEGRSWAEADVQVTGIRPSYLQEFREKGVCKAPGEVLSCRGNPCPGVEYGRIQDAGPSTGDLSKGFGTD